MSELDAQISALLERLRVSKGDEDERVEDALEPAEIGAPEENDDMLPDGP